MFRNHNIVSIFAGTLILLNCAVELYSLASINTVLFMGFDFNFYRALVILLLMISSIFGAVAILLRRMFALKICLAIYLVQIFGFIYNEVYYILSYGLWISWSTEIAGSSIEINLVAIFTSIVIFMAMKKNKQSQVLREKPMGSE